ncbi:MAG: hypothetical protein JWP75_2107 [Frondihabitans sp.]|nr:hypothetical protein [Frondihabitans sp.]
MPQVSVVIPARNAVSTIDDQLMALSRQTWLDPLEVIVVDNGSSDGTREAALRWVPRLTGLSVIVASGLQGVGYARNEGVAHARGSLVLFCDADDVVHEDWVAKMVTALVEADVVGGALDLTGLNDEPAILWQSVAPMISLPVAMEFLPYAIGANMGFRTEVYSALGGCDEAYLGASEDVELCWRAQLAGYRLAFAGEAIVDYRLRTTLRGLARQRFAAGRTFAQLFATYHDQVPARGWWRVEFWRWRHLAATAPQLLRRADAGRWLYDAGWHAGRLFGSFQQRLLCP